MKLFNIFQLDYDFKDHRNENNVSFLKIANSNPEWRELQGYVKIYQSQIFNESIFTGIISDKFQDKSKVSISEFKKFCISKQNYDVCLINPFPQISYWSYNVWMQGESAHPGLRSLAKELVEYLRLPITISENTRHSKKVLCYSNYWVGTKDFWEEYVGRILIPIAEFLEFNPNHPLTNKLMTFTSHTMPAPMLPFIIERMFTEYLSCNLNRLKIAYYDFSFHDILEKYCLNDYERILVESMYSEINAIDERSSPFPTELINKMTLLTKLWQQQVFDYYEMRPHPHTELPLKKLS